MYRKLLPWYMDQNNHSVFTKKVENRYFNHEKITLLNWNVHKNNHSFKWLQDFGHILQHHAPNIISFQEYQTKSKKSILDKHQEYGYGFCPNIEISSKNYGLLNASTCDIDNLNPIFSEHLEPLIKTPKISFLTQYKLRGNKKLTLINTHMINFVHSKKYMSQLKQLETLCMGEDILILTGDFNTWNIKRMHSLESLTKSLGLKQISFKLNHHKKKYLPFPLDHVFYKGLKPISTEILQHIKTSDHKPIIVNFTLNI